MKLETKQLLDAIDRAPLLQHLGEPIANPDIIQVSSWKEVQKVFPDYYTFTQERSNNISDGISDADWDDLSDVWNKDWHEMAPRIRTTVASLREQIRTDEKISKAIISIVEWELLSACEEHEFSEYTHSTYFRKQLEWYLSGHLPCGWKGKYPAGKLIVF